MAAGIPPATSSSIASAAPLPTSGSGPGSEAFGGVVPAGRRSWLTIEAGEKPLGGLGRPSQGRRGFVWPRTHYGTNRRPRMFSSVWGLKSHSPFRRARMSSGNRSAPC